MTDETPELTRAALLDEEGYFLRIDEVAELTALHLPQITDCDLPPDKYRWNADKQQFLYAPKKANPGKVTPDATRAVVKALDAIAQQIALPEESLRFIAEYKQTFDFKG